MQKENKQEIFLNPLSDIVFKTLWIRADEDLRLYFNRLLSWTLKRDFSGYTLGPNETGITEEGNIANKVDLLLEKDGVKVDIELNNGSKSIKQAMNKSLVYLSYYITTYYDNNKDHKYEYPIKVEQINFNNFHCPEGYQIEKLDYKFTDSTNKVSAEGIEYHHIYLPRMKEICYSGVKDNDIYKDFAMLVCESYKEMEELAGKDKGRCALVRMLKKLGSDEGMIDAARREEDNLLLARYDGEEVGLEKGIEQGIEQGMEKKQEEMIISMYNDNLPLEKISKYANISVDEVKKIIESSKEE